MLQADYKKMEDKIKGKLKVQTSLRAMVDGLIAMEKVSEGARQAFLKECFHQIKRELMNKSVLKRNDWKRAR